MAFELAFNRSYNCHDFVLPEILDFKCEATEAEYEGMNGIESISKGEKEILLVTDSEVNDSQVKTLSRSRVTRQARNQRRVNA